jgi:hypothetical protein
MSEAHVDKDGGVWFLGELGQTGVVQTVGQRHSRRLVDQLKAVEAGDLRGIEQRPALGIGHVTRHGDHAVVHLGVEIGLGDALELDKKRGHHLLGRELTRLVHVVDLEEDLLVGRRLRDTHGLIGLLEWHLRVVEFACEQALEVADRVGAVGDLLLLGRVTLETL